MVVVGEDKNDVREHGYKCNKQVPTRKTDLSTGEGVYCLQLIPTSQTGFSGGWSVAATELGWGEKRTTLSQHGSSKRLVY